MRITRRLLGSLLLLGAGGCGGSGGDGDGGAGGTVPGPPITATYHLVGFEGEATPTATGRAFWGRCDIDGAEASLTTTSNSNGTVGLPVVALGVPFENDVDGAVRFLDPVSDQPTLAGEAAVDTSVLLLGQVAVGASPSFIAMTRAWDGGATVADLSGTYRVVRLEYDAGTMTSVLFRLTFDGAGAGSSESGYLLNSNGTVLGGLRVVSNVTYTVDVDGGLSLDAGLGRAYRGAIHTSRELVILAGSTGAGPASVLFLVKEASAATAATFAGTYVSAGGALDFTTPALRSSIGRTVADGAGNATLDAITNVEGSIFVEPAAATTYSTEGTSTVNLFLPGAGVLRGAISGSGTFVALAGDFVAGEDPAIRLLARQP
jgi:hypothetical protein